MQRVLALATIRNDAPEAIIERALDGYLSRMKALEDVRGIWKDRDDIGDGLGYQERLRSEWDHRP